MNLTSFTQGTATMFSGHAEIRELLAHAELAVFNPETNTGYQRQLQPARVRKFAAYLAASPGHIVPTAIVLSSRQKLNLRGGTLNTQGVRLYVVDGQHRLEGFRYAIDRMKMDHLKSFKVPVVLFESETEVFEANQFRTINETAKKVSTDLARSLLARETRSPGHLEALRGWQPSRVWEVRAQTVAQAMNELDGSPWRGRLRMPNEEKSLLHYGKCLSFVTSLRPVFQESCPLSEYSDSEIAEVAAAYWAAIERYLPDAFGDGAPDYVVTRTPGMFILHRLLVNVAEAAREQGVRIAKETVFEHLLNRVRDPYLKSKFWHKESGRAGQAGSMKGFGMIADELEEKLTSK